MPNLPYISPELLSQYQREISSQASRATAKRKTASLKQFLGWAHKEGYVQENLADKLSAPPSYAVPAPPPPAPQKKYSPRLILGFGILAVSVILLFLLVKKLKLPVPFRPAPASEITTVTATSVPTPVAEKPVDTSTIIAEIKQEAIKIVQQTLEWASFEEGNLRIGGAPVSSLLLTTGDTTDGDITINPDGSGIAHFLFEGTGQNFLNAQAPNLTSGSLYYGIVANNATGYDLIRLQNGSNPITRFSVDAEGDTYASGDLNVAGDIQTAGTDRLTSSGALTNITGYTQTSGDFSITQNAGDFASISQKASALSDLLTLTLDERGKSNSIYSTLTLRRFDGASEAMALLVDDGNAQFDGQLRLGRFPSSPSSIGTASVFYNTTDNLIYYWDGSAWQSLGTAVTTPFSLISSGTNTTAAMVVSGSASLSFTDTGTITASELTCTGCVANSELANSSITFAGDTGSSATSLGGTRTIAGGEGIDTTEAAGTITIAGEDASTTNKGIASFDTNFFTVTTGAVTVKDDSLDFAQLQDSLDLDAATDIALGALTLSTSGTGALNFASTGQVTFAGNVDAANGLDVTTANLTVGGANFSVAPGTGNITTAGTLAVNGDQITSDGDLTLQPSGGQVILPTGVTINVGGLSNVGYNAFADATDAPEEAAIAADNDLYIGGDLEVDGTLYAASVTATALAWDDLTDPTANLTLSHAQYATTFNWNMGTDAAFDAWTSTITNDLVTDTTTQRLLVLKNLDDALTTGTTERLLVLDNADANEAVTTALEILASSTGTITTAIDVSDAEIGTALAFGANDIDGASFDVTGATGNITTAGDIAVNGGDITSTGTLRIAPTSTLDIDATIIDLSTQATAVTLNNTANALNFDSDTLTIDALNNRVGIGTTAPANDLHVRNPSDFVFLRLEAEGANASSGIFFFGRNTSTDRLGAIGYSYISDTYQFNYAGNLNTAHLAINSSGDIGIGDSGPDAKLEILATTEQLRLTNVDGTTDARFTVSATGDLTIDMLGSGTTDQLVLGDGDTINIGSGTASDVAYNRIANAADAPEEAAISSDNDLYIGGDLEVDGTIYGTVTATNMPWSGLTDPTANLSLNHSAFTTTMAWTSTGALDAWTTNFNNNSATATTQNALVINNAAVGSFTDANTESLILLQQLDTTTLGTTVLDNALKIDSAASSGITDAIEITNSVGNITNGINIVDSAGTFTTGINFSGTFTNEISLRNAETISNATDGTITLAANSGAVILSLSGTAGTLSNTAGDLTLDSASNTLVIAATDTALTASGIATIDFAATVGIDSTTYNLGGGTATTIQTPSGNANLSVRANGTGTLTLDTTGLGTVTVGGAGVQTINLTTNNDAAADINVTGGTTFNDEVTLTLAGTEALTVNNTTQGAADLVSINPTWTADNTADALAITTTYNLSTVVGTQYGLNLTNADNGVNTGVIDALALFSNDQATETLADGVIIRHNAASGTLTDALQIENTTAGGTITNAINIIETAGTVGTGINIGAGVGTAISLQGGESIDSTNANQINLNLGTAGTLLLTSATSSTISNSAGSIILDSTGGTIDINDAAIDVATQATDIEIIDNNAASLTISQGANNYITIDTTDTLENLILSAGTSATTRHVRIGATAASTTPDLLVVDKKSTAGDPTGTTGAIYLNSSDKFMIYENAAWKEICNKTDQACGTGTGSAWSALTVPTGDLSLNHGDWRTSFTWDTASDAARDYFSMAITNDLVTDTTTQRLLVLTNSDDAITTGTTERLLVLDNADANEAVTTALEILASSTGTIATAIDVSDAEIGTALAFGANDIDGTSFDVTGATGNITTAGDIAVNGGDITSTGTLRIAPTSTLDIDATIIDLSTQTVDVTLNNAADSLNFDSNTLSINALNNRVGIGTAAPISEFNVVGATSTMYSYDTTTGNAIQTFGKNPLVQLTGDGSINNGPGLALLQLNIGGADVKQSSSELYLAATRGTTASSRVAVDNTDMLGSIGFFGDDGTNIRSRGSIIQSVVDTSVESVATGVMPARLSLITTEQTPITFHTNAGALVGGNTPVTANERMRIDYSGNVGINDASPDAKLEVLSTTEQLRLTNVDGTTDARFTVSATGDLTIDLLGSGTTDQLVLGDGDTINIGSGTASDVAYNKIGDAADAPEEAAIAADNDLYIGGDLEVDGTIYGGTAFNCVDCINADDLADTIDFDAASETSWTLQADNVTTQSFLTVTTDGLTSGTGTTFDLTATGVTTAFSGDLVKLNQTQTYTGGAGTQSGNVLDIARSITRDITTAGDLALSGALATISDTAATSGAGTGTLTHSADVLRIAQNYTSNTGSALNVTSAGGATGFALRINDDGTFTDSTPFVVTNAGDVGIGTTGPGATLDVSSTVTTGVATRITANNLSSGFALQVLGTSNDTTAAERNLGRLTYTASPGSSSSTGFTALQANTQTSAGTNIANNITGISGYATNNSTTGTVNAARGVIGQIYNSGAGAIGNAYALTAMNPSVSAGSITNNWGLLVQAMTGGTNNVGITIGETTGTNHSDLVLGQTTIPTGVFAIYNSSTANNYFAGNVGIGDTSPAAALTVGNNDLFQVNSSGIIAAIDGVAHTIDDVSGNLTLTSNGTSVMIADDLGVNGATSADITSTTTTASLFDSTVTTLNIGGAVTALNLGDAATTKTIDIGGVTASGTDTINIATNATAADTINIGNVHASTATTISGGVINLTTDSTGNAEVVLPNDAIGPNEVFTTGQTDEFCLTYETTGGTWEWQNCGTAASVAWSSLTSPTADLTLAMATWNTTFNWVPVADTAETNFSMTIQGQDAVAGGEVDQVLLALSNASNSVDTDQAADSLLTLANNDLNDPVTSAIRFDAGALGTDFTYGINFTAASIGTAELILSNSATIQNIVNGTLALSEPTIQLIGSTSVDIDSPTIDLSTQTVDVTLNNAADSLNFDSNTLSIDALNNRVGILDASPAYAFVVGSGDLFQIDSSGNAKAPTLALGTATIAPTDRTLNVTDSTALTNSTQYGSVFNQTFTGTLTGNITDYGLYSGLTLNATDATFAHETRALQSVITLSDGNTTDTMKGGAFYAINASTTISPDPGVANTATSSAALFGQAYNTAAGITTNQWGGLFYSQTLSTGTITNAYGANGVAATNVDGSIIGTAYGVSGSVNELTAQTTGGITTGYGGYFSGQDATTTYGLWAQATQNTANTETFTNLYGIRNDCQTNGTNVTVTNCYGIDSSITETLGTITNGFAGYFQSSAAMATGYGVYANLSGASTTSYGLYSNVTGAGTTNYGVYSNVSGAGTNYAGIFAGGNVGIGDTTPTATLTVGSGDLFQVAGASGNITTAGDIAVNGGDITSTTTLRIAPTSTLDIDATIIDLSTQTVDVTLNNAADSLNFDSNTLSIDALNNRVGVGIANPTNVFQVALSANQMVLLGTTSVASGVSFVNGSILSQASQFQLVGTGTVPISFYTGGTFNSMTAGTEKMRLSAAGGLSLGNSYVGTDPGAGSLIASGNVGIGDTTPDAKLEVLATTEQLRLTNVDATTDARFTVSATGDLTIDLLGSGTTDQLVLSDTDTINIGGSGSTDVAYNVIGDSTTGASLSMDSDDDLYIEGNLEVDGTIIGTVVGSVAWNNLSAPTGDLTLAHSTWNTTFNWVPTADTAETNFSMTIQGQDAVAGGEVDQVLLALSNASNGVDTDQAADALLTLANNDLNDPVTSAIRFDAGAAGIDFTYGINFDAAGVDIGTAEIVLENGETIANQTDGTITLGADSAAVILSLSGTAATLSNTAGNLTVNAASNLVLADATIQLTGGTTVTMDLFNAATTTLSILNSTGGVAADVAIEGDLTVTGGDITGANSETIDIGEADNGSITFTGVGETNNGALTIDLETNAYPTINTGADTVLGLDEDLTFIGAQSITTTAGNLTVGAAGNLVLNSTGNIIDIDDSTLDLSTQTVGVTLNNAANALNFDSNTLTIDALNNRVGIGTASPSYKLSVSETTSVANTGVYGAYSSLTDSATADSTTAVRFASRSDYSKTGSANQTGFESGSAFFYSSVSGGSLSTLLNLESRVQVPTGGTVGTLSHFYVSPDFGDGGGTITNVRGLDVRNIGRAVSDQRGVYIADLTSGTTSNFAIYADGTTKSYFGGNVGIGDTTPDQLLEVLSSGAANTQLSIGNTNAGDFDPQIGFELADGTNTFTLGVDDSDGDKFKISTTALGTNDRFAIDSTGKVGIGTASPAVQQLTVDGGTRFRDAAATRYRSDYTVGSGGLNINAYDDTAGAYLPVRIDGLSFALRADGSDAKSLTLNNTGNVAIGHATPVARLDIIGSQNFSALSAPGALTAGTPTAGGSCTAGTHSYKVTFTSVGSGETTGGTTSNQITCVLTTGQTVPLTGIPIGPTGTTGRKIYRTVAGDTGSYLLVTTIADNSTTTYNDTTADGSLGVAAPVSNTTAVANIQTGGTTRMVIDSSGNVGIGDTTPTATLTVGNGDLFQVAGATGNITTAGDLYVNGGDINTASGNLTLQPAGTGTTANVQIGAGGAGSSTPDLLVLDAKDLTGNPAGTNGALYYNVADAKFKCYEAGAWTNCIGTGGGSSLWSALLDPTGNLTLNMAANTTTMNWDFAVDGTFWDMNFDNNGGTAGIDYAVEIANAVSTNAAGDLNTEALLRLDNADTNISGSTIVDNAILITNSGGITSGVVDAIDASATEIDNAINVGGNVILGTTANIDFTNFDVVGSSGNVSALGVGQFGGNTAAAYSRFGTSAQDHFGGTPVSSDLLISGKLEVRGNIFLDSADGAGGGAFTIADYQGTGTIIFPADPTTSDHSLTAGNWLVDNTANVGKAALIVNQTKAGDIFTASASGTKFVIANNGNVTISGSGTMLTVGGGTGKVDVGTVDPVYNISGTKFATYMAGMIGVKEETTGNISTNQYLPGIGYRTVIDFKTEPQGSDLWLFSRATDIKNNIDKMIVLLSPSDNTRTWYEVDEANYTLSIYSSRPTQISYRLTAPRFDSADWSNYNDNPESTGFQVEDAPLVGTGEENTPEAPVFSDFEIVKEVPQTVYKVYQTISEGSKIAVDEFGAFANLVTGNIKAGAIESKEIATETFTSFQGTIDNLLITGGLVSPIIQTETISPLADKSDVKVKIGNEAVDSGFGKLIVENTEGQEVAAIDTEGNATFSGTLEAEEVKTNEVIAGKIYADEIIARNGYFGQTNTASVSAITREEIESILREVEQDQDILAQASTWNVSTATNSANLDELAVSNFYVTDQAAINALSVTSTIALGPDLVLQSKLNEQNLIVNSIDTLSAPLSIQSLALAPVEIMAGKVRVETNGDLIISGNLFVAGKIESSGLTLKDTNGFGELLNLEDGSGNRVAAISASGSAEFATVSTEKLIIAGGDTAPKIADINQEIQTNATAGSAIIQAEITEITIRNSNISDYTLVYVTPTSSTQNSVLYVKSKGQGFFTVGFSQPLDIDVVFNWWVIDIHE